MVVDPIALFQYRLDRISEDVKRNTEWRENTAPAMAAQHVEFEQVKTALLKLSADVDGLRKVLVTLAVTIATSSIGFGFTILVATGKL